MSSNHENSESVLMKYLRYSHGFLRRWAWHYFASTCFIGLLAITNITESYRLFLFPLSGIVVLLVVLALPQKKDSSLDDDDA